MTAARQTFTVTQTAVVTEVHQAFDVHRNLLAKVTFDHVFLADLFRDRRDVVFGQFVDALVVIDTPGIEDEA